jgi:Protein of unknown function (DUF3176)
MSLEIGPLGDMSPAEKRNPNELADERSNSPKNAPETKESSSATAAVEVKKVPTHSVVETDGTGSKTTSADLKSEASLQKSNRSHNNSKKRWEEWKASLKDRKKWRVWALKWSVLELLSLLLAALFIVGMSVFLWWYDGGPAPTWSYIAIAKRHKHIPPWLASRRITFNAILTIFSKGITICLGYSIAKAMAKLTWIWYMGKENRRLADIEKFNKAAKKSWKGSAQLIWMLKFR